MNFPPTKPLTTLHNLGSTKALLNLGFTKALEALEALEAHYNLGSEEVSL